MNRVEENTLNLSDEQAFQNVFNHLYAPLCRFANAYVSDEAASADLVQDCFVKLWERRANFNLFPQIKSFMYTSVRNSALNEIEHLKVVSQHEKSEETKASEAFFRDHLIEEEVYRLLFSAIEVLPRQTKKVMEIALEGLSNAEIADRMGVSIETVRTLKKDGYKKIRKFMGNYYQFLPLLLPYLFK